MSKLAQNESRYKKIFESVLKIRMEVIRKMDLIYHSIPHIKSVEIDRLKLEVPDPDSTILKRSEILYNGSPLSVISSIKMDDSNNAIVFPDETKELMSKIARKFDKKEINGSFEFARGRIEIYDQNLLPAGELGDQFFRTLILQPECKVLMTLKQSPGLSSLFFGVTAEYKWTWEISAIFFPKYKSPTTKMHEEILYIFESLQRCNAYPDWIVE